MAYKGDSSKINYSELRPHKRDYNFKINCNCKEWMGTIIIGNWLIL